MLIERYFQPFYAAEVETGAPEGDGGAPPSSAPEADEETSEEVSPRGQLREQLEKNFEADRKATEGRTRKPRSGRTAEQIANAAAGESDPEAAPETTATAAPDAFPKEAKAEWAKVPPAVQAAILKREQDTAKGVEELKSKYSEIDKALQPHIDAIRRHGHSPAQAISQLFAWFQALAANPKVAFPALAKSFNLDLKTVLEPEGVKPEGEKPAPAVEGLPEPVQKYISTLEQKLKGLEETIGQKIGTLETTFAQQSQAKTEEILMNWAKDKAHFQEVRGLMAQLVSSGAVPLKDGQVDLDAAYDMALYASPEVRQKVLTERQEAERKAAEAKAEAERKAQADKAAQARRAAVSVGGGAPGASGSQGTGKPKGKGKSVRESILEAREQLSS